MNIKCKILDWQRQLGQHCWSTKTFHSKTQDKVLKLDSCEDLSDVWFVNWHMVPIFWCVQIGGCEQINNSIFFHKV
jgi:hypothetical protein